LKNLNLIFEKFLRGAHPQKTRVIRAFMAIYVENLLAADAAEIL